MQIGKVVGTVVADSIVDSLKSFKLLIVDICDEKAKVSGEERVLVDTMNAGPDDLVLFSEGSSCRQSDETDGRPVDGMVLGIIDIITLHDKNTYVK